MCVRANFKTGHLAAKAKAKRQAVRAKAERDELIKNAEAEAKAKRLRAKAEAEHIRQVAEALEQGDGVIRHILATAWDGHLPNVTAGETEIINEMMPIADEGSDGDENGSSDSTQRDRGPSG